MRLLRSEEDLPSDGASMPVAQLERLARAWYGDRMDPDWRPRTPDQSQAILESVGLTDRFWQLGP
jgi:hypothetical protein